MPDNYEEDPTISPCVNCSRRLHGDCSRCKHRNDYRKHSPMKIWTDGRLPTYTISNNRLQITNQ